MNYKLYENFNELCDFVVDRLKENETDLSNCMSIINKLKPQIYQKYTTFKWSIGDTRANSVTKISPENFKKLL